MVAAIFIAGLAVNVGPAWAQDALPDPATLKSQGIATPGGSVRPPAGAVNLPGGSVRRAGEVGKAAGPIPPPSHAIGNQSVTDEFWSRIRHGQGGDVVLPGRENGILIQSAGEDWRLLRNEQVTKYGGQLLLAVLAAIVLFFAVRGRIKIKGGRSGRVMPVSVWRSASPIGLRQRCSSCSPFPA